MTLVAVLSSPQRPGLPGGQVDLEPGAVQPEADGAFGLTAIKVIDQQSLYLLSQATAVLSRPAATAA